MLHFLAWLIQSGVALDDAGSDIVARFAALGCPYHSSPRRVGQYYINRVGRFVCHLVARGVVPPKPVAEHRRRTTTSRVGSMHRFGSAGWRL